MCTRGAGRTHRGQTRFGIGLDQTLQKSRRIDHARSFQTVIVQGECRIEETGFDIGYGTLGSQTLAHGHHTGDMGTGHARATHLEVLIIGSRGPNVDARCRNVGPSAVIGKTGPPTSRDIRRGHGHHVGMHGGIIGRVGIAIAGRKQDQHIMVQRILESRHDIGFVDIGFRIAPGIGTNVRSHVDGIDQGFGKAGRIGLTKSDTGHETNARASMRPSSHTSNTQSAIVGIGRNGSRDMTAMTAVTKEMGIADTIAMIVAKTIIHVTIAIVIDAIVTYFTGVDPGIRGQVNMVHIPSGIQDMDNGFGRMLPSVVLCHELPCRTEVNGIVMRLVSIGIIFIIRILRAMRCGCGTTMLVASQLSTTTTSCFLRGWFQVRG